MKYQQKIKTKLSKQLTPLWLCIYIDILGYAMLTPFLPQIMLELDVPVALTGVFLSIPPLIGFFTNIMWGSLSDRIGRKPVILILRAGTVVSYLLLAAANNIWLIIISRVIAGVFNAVIPVSMTMMSDLVSQETRGYELSKIGYTWLVGSIIGPAIGTLVMRQGAFGLGAFNAVLIAVTVIVTQFLIKESIEFQSDTLSEEMRKSQSAISFSLLKKPLPRLLLIQSLFNRIPYFMFVMTTSLYLTIRFNFTHGQLGTFYTLTNIANLVIRLTLFPRLLRKIGDDNTVRLGFVLYLIAFGWLILAGHVWEFAFINLIMSFATSSAIDVMTGVMGNAVKKEEMGKMLGLSSASESMAMVLGPMIGGSLLALQGNIWYGLFGLGMGIIPLILDFLPLRRAHYKKY